MLDDGFVRVVDYLGNDQAIAQAARVSYGAGTKRVREDEALIRYLMRHRHTSPFEMCELKVHVRVPMDCWRQWIRHRTANVNEYSTRYSEAIDSMQKTAEDQWRKQSDVNKQGSDEFLGSDLGKQLSTDESWLHKESRRIYEKRIEANIAREQARKDLPLSTYTEAYWKIDLHNLFHFLSLRMAASAQEEIRAYANVLGHEIVKRWCPVSWQAFLDYRMESMNLSRRDREVMRAIVKGDHARARTIAVSYGWLGQDGSLPRNRERLEAEVKFAALGIHDPWIANSTEGS